MVIAVVRDKPPIFVVRREETNGTARSGVEHEAPVIIAPDAMGLEKLSILIEAERSAMLLLISDVGCGSRCNHHRPCRQLHATIFRLETNRYHMIAFIDDGFIGVHILDERNAFLESFDDFFVVQAICRRVHQTLAVYNRYATPRADQRNKIRFLTRDSSSRSL